jgi:hypothetical protein
MMDRRAAKNTGGLIQINATHERVRCNGGYQRACPPPSQARKLGAESFELSAPIFCGPNFL